MFKYITLTNNLGHQFTLYKYLIYIHAKSYMCTKCKIIVFADYQDNFEKLYLLGNKEIKYNCDEVIIKNIIE